MTLKIGLRGIAVGIMVLTALPRLCVGQARISSPDNSGATHFLLFKSVSNENGAAVIMLPGMGETPENVVIETSLPEAGQRSGFTVFIPSLINGISSLGVEKDIINRLGAFIKYVRTKYNVDKVLLMGFSAGGALAIRYSEVAAANTSFVQPQAVVAVDPPLDFERLYNALQRNIRLADSDKTPQAAIRLSVIIEAAFDGTPNNNLASYHMLSPYSFSDTTQSAIKKIRNMPIMIINEPDVEWLMKKYGHDYYSMNVLDAAAMINELQRLGNQNTRLVLTAGKGLNKQSGSRTTHAWSIADPEETVKWLLEQIK